MNNQYKKALTKALKENVVSVDTVSVVREILSHCGVDFPYGSCRGVLDTLSSNDFTGWRECSAEEAEKYANEGIPAVGVSSECVFLIEPNDIDLENQYILKINSANRDEQEKSKYYAYSDSSVLASFNRGTVSDVPTTMTKDGFAGWYNPAPKCLNLGVSHRIPRFAQLASGPCMSYCIMMGDYYLRYRDTYPDAAAWFNANLSNYYTPDQGAYNAEKYVDNADYSLNALWEQMFFRKPAIVSGNSGHSEHFALVVACVGCYASENNFVVIDPIFNVAFPTTLTDFKARYPYQSTQRPSGLMVFK